ncbi:MAG: class I SAM-dependent methyltransferase [Bacteroidales bacterium]
MEPSPNTPLEFCPACGAPNPGFGLECTDHFLSQERFTIMRCHTCRVLFTQPQPKPDAIGRYYRSEKYISHSDTSKGVVNKVYRYVRSIAVNQKYRLVSRYQPKGSLLDIGCGTGHLLNTFASHGWQTKGIEPGSEARKYAMKTFGLDVEDEPALANLPDASFDVVSMWHVLEHVHDVRERMGQVKRVLKDGGLAVVALPNHASWDAKHYGPFWAAWDVPRHLYHFNREALELLARESGFMIHAILPMKFDAYYVSILSEEYSTGRKRFLHAALKGWKSNRKASGTGEYSSLIYLLRKQP